MVGQAHGVEKGMETEVEQETRVEQAEPEARAEQAVQEARA